MSRPMIPFNAWLKEKLVENGMTQAMLAEATGITPANINRYIKGEAEPRLYTLWRIAQAFGCELKVVQPKEQEAEIEQLKRFVNGFSRDAMPVVRCKDCKHGGIDSTSYPQFWCSAHSEYHKPDWFCADGERKEGR